MLSYIYFLLYFVFYTPIIVIFDIIIYEGKNMSINDSLIKLIKKYQDNKPAGTPARCVHYPSCSNYSIECYKKFNFFKASFLTVKRILFCTPLNKKFYDPVPLSKEEKLIEK